MTTDIFIKKRWRYLVCAQALALAICSFLLYAFYLNGMESVSLGKSFYFLLSDSQYSQAGSFQAQLDGGAGYCFEKEGGSCVAYSVYLDREKGKLAQKEMKGKAQIFAVTAERLYFKGVEKDKKQVYLGALNSLYGCITALSYAIDRLDGGGTQNACKSTLSLIARQLLHLGKTYERNFAPCAKVGKEAGEQLQSLSEGIVYAGEVRYLLCDLSVNYLELTKLFDL